MIRCNHFLGARFLGLFTPRSDRSRFRRPRLDGGEPLERRSMLAGDFEGGVLTIMGTESDDVISVTAAKVNGEAAVRVRGPDFPKKGVVFAGVDAVVIRSFNGNDRVVVGPGLRTASGGLLAVEVDAGAGNDVVVGGEGDDKIVGGDGDDILRGGKGNDDVDGGDDNDRCIGDDGDDTLIGGGGNDDLRGGKGNDSAYGGTGEDRLLGGVGDDDLDGGRDDGPGGDRDDDRLNGGPGNDDDVDDDDSFDDDDDDDLGDNENEDEDEDEDEDDEDGVDGDDDDGVGDPGVVPSLAFDGNGVANASGSSLNKQDKKFFSFTLAGSTNLVVTMNNVDGGRYPDLEIERQGGGAEVERELEPSEGGPTSGTFSSLPAGTYSLRLRSPDLLPVNFSVSLFLNS